MDHLYVALPLEEHTKLLTLLDTTSREFLDVKVVPDLLQFIALRARLEDLDGLPVINVNDVPLQGLNTWVKRGIDIGLSSVALLTLTIPLGLIAMLVKLNSPGPVSDSPLENIRFPSGEYLCTLALPYPSET